MLAICKNRHLLKLQRKTGSSSLIRGNSPKWSTIHFLSESVLLALMLGSTFPKQNRRSLILSRMTHCRRYQLESTPSVFLSKCYMAHVPANLRNISIPGNAAPFKAQRPTESQPIEANTEHSADKHAPNGTLKPPKKHSTASTKKTAQARPKTICPIPAT